LSIFLNAAVLLLFAIDDSTVLILLTPFEKSDSLFKPLFLILFVGEVILNVNFLQGAVACSSLFEVLSFLFLSSLELLLFSFFLILIVGDKESEKLISLYVKSSLNHIRLEFFLVFFLL
jgi:hypothetical protein